MPVFKSFRWRPLLAMSCALLACGSALAQATPYPTRPIRMVMPFAAGSGFDTIVRIVSEKLGDELGQSVVVDNQAGAGGIVGSQLVARAAPDGYTLIFQSVSSAVVIAAVNSNLRYDPVKSFAPISLMSQYPLAMIVNPNSPARTVAEFTAMLKQKPDAYSYGSSGVGTGIHLAAELYKLDAGVSIQHIPYKGTAPAEQDVAAGRTQMTFAAVPTVVGRIANGQVRAIAVSTLTRSPALPDVPTMIESGIQGFNVPFWNGIYAPVGTPQPVIDKLAAACAKVMRDPAVVARLKELGADAIGSSPAEFDKFWKEQLALYASVVKRANIKIE